MILTGKANTDFLIWINNHRKHRSLVVWKNNKYVFDVTNETLLYALIIEWFDSVGININTTPFDYEINSGLWEEIKSYKNIVDYNRTEVQGLAIEKANEIYNSKFNK